MGRISVATTVIPIRTAAIFTTTTSLSTTTINIR